MQYLWYFDWSDDCRVYASKPSTGVALDVYLPEQADPDTNNKHDEDSSFQLSANDDDEYDRQSDKGGCR